MRIVTVVMVDTVAAIVVVKIVDVRIVGHAMHVNNVKILKIKIICP